MFPDHRDYNIIRMMMMMIKVRDLPVYHFNNHVDKLRLNASLYLEFPFLWLRHPRSTVCIIVSCFLLSCLAVSGAKPTFRHTNHCLSTVITRGPFAVLLYCDKVTVTKGLVTSTVVTAHLLI